MDDSAIFAEKSLSETDQLSGENGEFLVTVILLCRNHAPFVEEALDSVLSQTVESLELRIYDIGSEDNSAAIIESWLGKRSNLEGRVYFHRHSDNIGVVRALKFGVNQARGKYIRALSTDDSFSQKDSLKQQIEAFEQTSENVAICFTDIRVVDSNGIFVETRKILPARKDKAVIGRHTVRRKLMSGNWIPAPSVLMRANAVAQAVANLDESLVFEDYQLWMDLSLTHDFLYVPSPLVNYRRHAQSFTKEISLARLLLRGEVVILGRALRASPEIGLHVFGASRSLLVRSIRLRDFRSAPAVIALVGLGCASPIIAKAGSKRLPESA